ncbi:type II toxin-antitoxin system RelE/ParE family toxin [Bartonella sp. LJL80]
MHNVIIADEAINDLFDILDYIQQFNETASENLKAEFYARLAMLAEHPFMYRTGRVRGTREMVMGKYVVIYAADATEVLVLRVLHGAQQWPLKKT